MNPAVTICLVSKGREDFLPEALASFKVALDFPEISIFILDNGSDPVSRAILMEFAQSAGSRVKLERLEENSIDPDITWPVIKAHVSGWVILPGDDDRISPSIFPIFWSELKRNPQIIAFGSSAKIINSDGSPNGKNVSPALCGMSNGVEQVNLALSEPPFFWPGLIFKLESIPNELPRTRYVFDWFIGLSLVLSGKVVASPEIGIEYRVHEGQESFQAPLRRKLFEAMNILPIAFESATGHIWLEKLQADGAKKFVGGFKANPALYGDREFGLPLRNKLIEMVLGNFPKGADYLDLYSTFAELNAIYYKNGELQLSAGFKKFDVLPSLFSNIGIHPLTGSCEKLTEVTKSFADSDDSRFFNVKCQHSKLDSRGQNAILIDCQLPTDLIADSVIVRATEMLESSGEIEMKISAAERGLIRQVRHFKGVLPTASLQKLKRRFLS